MSKRFLKRIMAAAAAIIFICSAAMAENFSFEGEREECEFSALNRGSICERDSQAIKHTTETAHIAFAERGRSVFAWWVRFLTIRQRTQAVITDFRQ